MVCGCKVPVEQYPENAEWGPLFWKLLHGLAQHSGTQTDSNLQSDEIRNWIHIFTGLQNCIPCDICRAHYGVWLKNHPVNVLSTMPYTEIGQWIRHWFWNLHNEINEGNDKPVFEESQLEDTYKHIEITPSWRALEPVMKLAINLNGISLLPWKKWLSYLRTVQGLYGIP
jgi:hypothetical protein